MFVGGLGGRFRRRIRGGGSRRRTQRFSIESSFGCGSKEGSKEDSERVWRKIRGSIGVLSQTEAWYIGGGRWYYRIRVGVWRYRVDIILSDSEVRRGRKCRWYCLGGWKYSIDVILSGGEARRGGSVGVILSVGEGVRSVLVSVSMISEERQVSYVS